MLNQTGFVSGGGDQQVQPAEQVRRPEIDVDPEKVRRARRLLDLGLLDRPEAVDRAVDELLAQYLAGKLDLVSVDGQPIDNAPLPAD